MSQDYYIFGGTFDPVHEGHVGVLRELLAQNKKIVIAPTESNPLKNAAKASFDQRLQMIKQVLEYEKIEYAEKFGANVYLCSFKYNFVCDFVQWWKKEYKESIFWVIGPDLVEQVTKWKNWDKLNLKTYIAKNYADNLHSTEIRNAVKQIHPALRNVKLYQI